MLENYIFNDCLRYEAHRIIYTSTGDAPIELTGMLGAALLAALLVDTPEGDARGIAVDSPDQREQFFLRYEREVRRENGGLFVTEVKALSQNYIEMTGMDGVLFAICGNDRLFDLALGLLMEYMQRLVREEVRASVYELVPWEEPFAQWLYNAAFTETRRQYLLSFNWTNAAAVYALNDVLQNGDNEQEAEPTFYFEGIASEQILELYYQWLMETVRQQTSVMPDGQEQLARLYPLILSQETNWDFIRPEVGKLSSQHINLFHKWMERWKEFITRKIDELSAERTFPKQSSPVSLRQEIFPDDVMPCPPKNNYVAVCEYIHERCRYDKSFHTYYSTHTRVRFCEQLTMLFGWIVDDNALGKRLNYRKKYKK